MENRQLNKKINKKTMQILKKNMIHNLLNFMTTKQRKEIFEFIGKHYNLETGEEK